MNDTGRVAEAGRFRARQSLVGASQASEQRWTHARVVVERQGQTRGIVQTWIRVTGQDGRFTMTTGDRRGTDASVVAMGKILTGACLTWIGYATRNGQFTMRT